MLPSLPHKAPLENLQINKLQDKLEYAARDIEEDRRERARMREQLGIQNEVISKLYTRLNQLEEEQAESSKILNTVMQSSLLQSQIETRKQAKLDQNLASDVASVKRKFDNLKSSIHEETGNLRHITEETHTVLATIQDHVTSIDQSDKTNSARIGTIESNVTAAMDCIRSLQSSASRLQSRIAGVESLSGEREGEIATSLTTLTTCLTEARTERDDLRHAVSDSSKEIGKMKQSLDERIRQLKVDIDSARQKKDLVFTQSLEEMMGCYRSLDLKITEEIGSSFQETKHLITALQSSILKEKGARLEWEQKLRRDTATVLNNLRKNLGEQIAQYASVYKENRGKTTASIKQLNTSIGLIEKSVNTTKHSIEHILQAEIKTRSTKLLELEDHLATVRAAVGALDTRREDQFLEIQSTLNEELKSLDSKFQEEIQIAKKGAEQTKEILIEKVRESEDATRALLSELREEMRGEVTAKAEETQEQIEVIAEAIVQSRATKISESLESFQAQMENLEKMLDAEVENRKLDLVTINDEVKVKVDKLTHEAELGGVRGAVAAASNQAYLLEERLCSIETEVEERYQTVLDRVAALEGNTADKENDASVRELRKELGELRAAIDRLQRVSPAAVQTSSQRVNSPSPQQNPPPRRDIPPRSVANSPPATNPPPNNARDAGPPRDDVPPPQYNDAVPSPPIDPQTEEILIPEQL